MAKAIADHQAEEEVLFRQQAKLAEARASFTRLASQVQKEAATPEASGGDGADGGHNGTGCVKPTDLATEEVWKHLLDLDDLADLDSLDQQCLQSFANASAALKASLARAKAASRKQEEEEAGQANQTQSVKQEIGTKKGAEVPAEQAAGEAKKQRTDAAGDDDPYL